MQEIHNGSADTTASIASQLNGFSRVPWLPATTLGFIMKLKQEKDPRESTGVLQSRFVSSKCSESGISYPAWSLFVSQVMGLCFFCKSFFRLSVKSSLSAVILDNFPFSFPLNFSRLAFQSTCESACCQPWVKKSRQ
jgi:hypothetical protein